MRKIPISAAKRIAEDYGYDQVIIYARRVGDDPDPHGEHMTTYGRDKAHCAVAAQIGDRLKYEIMGWRRGEPPASAIEAPAGDETQSGSVHESAVPVRQTPEGRANRFLGDLLCDNSIDGATANILSRPLIDALAAAERAAYERAAKFCTMAACGYDDDGNEPVAKDLRHLARDILSLIDKPKT